MLNLCEPLTPSEGFSEDFTSFEAGSTRGGASGYLPRLAGKVSKVYSHKVVRNRWDNFGELPPRRSPEEEGREKE